MRALIIKPEPLERILSGKKTWELRGSRTRIRERIGLIASGSGTIIGEADLVDCIGPLDRTTYEANVSKHRSKDSFQKQYPSLYAWVLKDVKRIKPRPYSHPRGAIIWVIIDDPEEKR